MSRTGMPVARSLLSSSSQSRSASLKRRRPSAVRSMRSSRPIRSYQRSVYWVIPHFSAACLVVQPVTSSTLGVRVHSNANGPPPARPLPAPGPLLQPGQRVGQDLVALAEREPHLRPPGLAVVVEHRVRDRDHARLARQVAAELHAVGVTE